jgi:uncharacterized membrane protein YraQ (UPF0718 family)
MELSIAIVGGLVLALSLIALVRGGAPMVFAGYREGVSILLAVAPQLALGFLLAGLVTVLVPSDLVARLIGEGSGLQGIVIATIAGILTPGGPYLQFPLIAALARSGAGVGALGAYLTAWSLIGGNRAVVWEIPILGPSFTAARWAISLLVPIGVGLLLPAVLRLMSRPA